MLKTIKGKRYMTGTSEGSLYPVVLTHPNGVMVGVRLNIQKAEAPGHYGVNLYARVEKIVGDTPVPATTAELFEAMPNFRGRFASPTHFSGSLGGGVMDTLSKSPNQSPAELAGIFGELFQQAITSIEEGSKKDGGKTVAVDPELLKVFGAESYMAQVVGDDETKIEDQLQSGAPFDFKSMLGKPDPTQ